MEKIDSGKIKLSIIIPYYETYNLTMKLLRELALQKKCNEEVEILVIDDYCKGEISKTKIEGINEIFDNNFIRVIKHEKNMGVAKSRNEGIKQAKGKYIAFIDCDDMITMDYIDTLLKAIDTYDTDVINFNWYDMTEHREYRKPHNPAPWKQIYKRETIPNFREDMEYGSEDVIFQSEIDSGKYTITYLDKLLYFYNSNREGSLLWKKKHKEEIK
jgi:glycosyltransferase involved in cell wall biosynthesis